MDPKDFDIVELCVGSQYYRGDVAPARATWANSFRHGYKGEAYHSGSFFTTDINRHINDQYEAAWEEYKAAKATYDQAMIDALDDPAAQKDLKEPKKPRRSLRKYKGAHWSPFFMLDIDTRRVGPKWDLQQLDDGGHKWHRRSDEEREAWEADNPDHIEDTDAARVEALEVIRCLEKLGVDPEMLVICFSGGKGFHIYVPTAYFNPEPCVNFIYRIRWMVENGLIPMLDKEKVLYPEDSVDWQVFDRLKALRAVNSKHQSGGWKIPIAYRTLQSMSLDQIRKIATRPNLDYGHPNWRDVAPSEQLRELWDDPKCEAFKKPQPPPAKKERKGAPADEDDGRPFDTKGRKHHHVRELSLSGPVPNAPLCAVKLSREDVGSGNRHQACLILITTWWRAGVSEEEARRRALKWLAMQAGTKHDADYIDRQIESIYGDNYNWGCNHPLAKANCFKACRLYQHSRDDDWAETQDEVELHWMPDALDDLLERERQEVLYFLPYAPFKEEIRLRSKQVVFFVAETATGKTAFWLDVCRANSQGLDYLRSIGEDVEGGCGFASLEMPREELAERGAQWVTGEDQQFISGILQEQMDAEDNDSNSERYLRIKELLEHHYRNVWIAEEDGVDIKKLKQLIRKGKEEHGIGLWIVDYMGRMKGRGMNQHERLSSLARDMKTVARETEALLVVLVQVSRSQSEKGTPGLRSGRGSGEIEESADILITAHRPDRHEDKDLSDDEKTEKKRSDSHRGTGYRVVMTAQKVRSGQPGRQSVLWFEGKSMRFTPIKEWERQEQEYIDSFGDHFSI